MSIKKLLYIFVSLAVSLILLILGFFAFTPKDITVPDDNSSPNSLEVAECVGEACDVSELSLLGTVKKSDEVGDYTHFLESNSGETIAFLKTPDDKLTMVEEMLVTITGTAVRFIGDIPLITVSGIKF